LLATRLRQVHSKVETSKRQTSDRQEVVGDTFTTGPQKGRHKQATDRVTAGKKLLVTRLRRVHSKVDTSKRQTGDRQEVVGDKFAARSYHKLFAVGSRQAGDRQGHGRVTARKRLRQADYRQGSQVVRSKKCTSCS